MKEIKETIEILADFRNLQGKINELVTIEPNIPIVEALSHAITLLQTIAESGELPEKVNAEDLNGCSYGVNAGEAIGHNQMHDIARPIIDRYKIEVAELESKLDYPSEEIKELQQKLQAAEARIKELEGQVKVC